MLHPSYTDLINVVNSDIEPGETAGGTEPVIPSSLRLPDAPDSSLRGQDPMVAGAAGKKPLSIAIDELYHQR